MGSKVRHQTLRGYIVLVRIVNGVTQWTWIGRKPKDVEERRLHHYNGKSDNSKHMEGHMRLSPYGIISKPNG